MAVLLSNMISVAAVATSLAVPFIFPFRNKKPAGSATPTATDRVQRIEYVTDWQKGQGSRAILHCPLLRAQAGR